MAKSSNDQFKEVINSVENKLSFITVNEKTISLLKSDNKFDELFCNMLETLVSLEKKLKIKDLKSTNLISAYKSITNKEPKGKSLKYSDSIDIDDQLSYIDVYLINTFGHDFIQKNVDETKDVEEVVDTKIVDGQEVHNFSNNNSNNQNFNAEEFLKNNNVTMDAMAEQIINQQAQYLLRKDIMDNKIFKYDSKPKIVVWLKMLNNVLFFLFAAFTLTLCILQWTTTYISTIDNKIYRIISGGLDPFIILPIIILLLYAGVKLFSEIKYFKNDNFKYTVKLTHIFLISLIFIFFLINFINFLKAFNNAEELIGKSFGWVGTDNNKRFDIVDSNSGGDVEFTNTQSGFEIIKVQYIFIIMIISTFGVLLLNSIILFTIKPRVDFNRMQQIANQYAQDIKNGKISQDSINGTKGSNPFGSMFF